MDKTIVLFYRLSWCNHIQGGIPVKKFIVLLLILGLLSGCTAPGAAQPTEASTPVTEPASNPLEGPEGLPSPAL